jgi:hypothetical protein
MFAKTKEVRSIKLDPERETADIDESNNSWPRAMVPTRFELFNSKPCQEVPPAGLTQCNNQKQPTKKNAPITGAFF